MQKNISPKLPNNWLEIETTMLHVVGRWIPGHADAPSLTRLQAVDIDNKNN